MIVFSFSENSFDFLELKNHIDIGILQIMCLIMREQFQIVFLGGLFPMTKVMTVVFYNR